MANLDLQLLVAADLPAPRSVITAEVAYAASQAVRGLRYRSAKRVASK